MHVATLTGDRIGQHRGQCATTYRGQQRADRIGFDHDPGRDALIGEVGVDLQTGGETGVEQDQRLAGQPGDRQRCRARRKGWTEPTTSVRVSANSAV